jgi:hypothetical protein
VDPKRSLSDLQLESALLDDQQRHQRIRASISLSHFSLFMY